MNAARTPGKSKKKSPRGKSPLEKNPLGKTRWGCHLEKSPRPVEKNPLEKSLLEKSLFIRWRKDLGRKNPPPSPLAKNPLGKSPSPPSLLENEKFPLEKRPSGPLGKSRLRKVPPGVLAWFWARRP